MPKFLIFEMNRVRNFAELIDDSRWMNVEEYLTKENVFLERDLRLSMRLRERLRGILLRSRQFRERLFRVDARRLRKSLDILYSGCAVASDGSIAVYPTAVGAKVRVGVVVVSYKGKLLSKEAYVSDFNTIDVNLKDPLRVLASLEGLTKRVRRIYNALMLYKEREYVLRRKREWGFIHGPPLPLSASIAKIEMPGLLESFIGLAGEILDDKKLISVVSRTSMLRILNVGVVLEPGEYVDLGGGGFMLSKMLGSAQYRIPELHGLVRRFDEEYKLGVYRVGLRPYIFMASSDLFHEGAHLIMADSLHQRLRGFPLLIDYADAVCHSLFRARDFKHKIEHRLMRMWGRLPVLDVPERRLRSGAEGASWIY